MKKILGTAVLIMVNQAYAGVTITPMLGYDFMSYSHDNQRDAIRTDSVATGGLAAGTGIAQESDVIEAIAAGIELTNHVDFELEYQQIQTMARKNAATIPQGYFDSREQNYNGNFLLYSSMFGLATDKLKPYGLIGAGHSNIEAKDDALSGAPGRVVVASTSDTIANVGMGAKYVFNRNVALRGEGRLVYNTDNSWVEPMALIGIQWRYDGVNGAVASTAPYGTKVSVIDVAEVAPLDTDKDGVMDAKDTCPDTPMSYAVDTVGCPIDVVDEERLEIMVLFDTDKSIIKPQFQSEIAKVAAVLKQSPDARAVIEGHTDDRASAAYNDALSLKRANAVKQALIAQYGIEASRLSAVGKGEAQPAFPNNNADNRYKNRRTIAIVRFTTTSKQMR